MTSAPEIGEPPMRKWPIIGIGLFLALGLWAMYTFGYAWGYVICATGPLTVLALSRIRVRKAVAEVSRRLAARQDVDPSEQLAAVQGIDSIDKEDFARLWYGIAAYYRVDPRKLRADDDFLREFRGLWTDVARDLWLDTGFALQRGPAKQLAEDAFRRGRFTVADLILILHQFELDQGEEVVQERRSAHRTTYNWRFLPRVGCA